MNSKKLYPALLVLSLSMIILLGIPATADDAAQPELPHAFYGMVEAGGSPVGKGLVVEAVGPGVLPNIAGNPVITLADGTYGAVGFASQKLVVQGDLTAGTPLGFYVGGIKAEVYDVAAGGPWKADYSFQPGEVTELNLRIASQPAAGQTREPTLVQTVAASSTAAAPPVAASGGPLLPQLPDSSGQQSASGSTSQSTEGAAPTAIAGQEGIPQGGSQQSSGQESEAGPVALPSSGNMTLYIAVGILLLLAIGGGAYYFTRQKKSDTEEKKEAGKKEE